ncbi:MAG TPA: GNAT family N-acetyltransferase [Candidatus Didemnitutus sp.]|nr:GNAT family N-acetyltransferase [Candidatus Didemnitutus sp.]
MPKPKSNSDKRVVVPRTRPARASDRTDWLRLRRALWPDCSEAMHRLEMKQLARPSRKAGVLVLDDGRGCVVGFIELSIRGRVDGSTAPRVGYIEGWFIEPAFRRQGWGRRLVAAAGDWCRRRGLSELASDSELANRTGQAAHRALGFRETFRLVHFVKKVR